MDDDGALELVGESEAVVRDREVAPRERRNEAEERVPEVLRGVHGELAGEIVDGEDDGAAPLKSRDRPSGRDVVDVDRVPGRGEADRRLDGPVEIARDVADDAQARRFAGPHP